MLKLEILRWTVVSGLAAALLRWPHPGAPFWSFTAGRPFVLARATVDPGSFRNATPA